MYTHIYIYTYIYIYIHIHIYIYYMCVSVPLNLGDPLLIHSRVFNRYAHPCPCILVVWTTLLVRGRTLSGDPGKSGR